MGARHPGWIAVIVVIAATAGGGCSLLFDIDATPARDAAPDGPADADGAGADGGGDEHAAACRARYEDAVETFRLCAATAESCTFFSDSEQDSWCEKLCDGECLSEMDADDDLACDSPPDAAGCSDPHASLICECRRTP